MENEEHGGEAKNEHHASTTSAAVEDVPDPDEDDLDDLDGEVKAVTMMLRIHPDLQLRYARRVLCDQDRQC